MTARLILNLLATVGLAGFAGVMLAIGVILGTWWRTLAPAEFLDWFAQYSPVIARTIPLTLAPAVLGLAGSLWIGWADPAARGWWLAAAAATGIVLALTLAWHLPANAAFAARTLPLEEVPARLHTWLVLHGVRIAAGFIAAICAGIAVARTGLSVPA